MSQMMGIFMGLMEVLEDMLKQSLGMQLKSFLEGTLKAL